MLKLIILFFLFYSYSYNSVSDEIVQDRNGNYFLMKSDGTFEKLPKPKQGNKYIIKKKKRWIKTSLLNSLQIKI